MQIIALTGLARSGKDTAAKYIGAKYSISWFDFSRDVLMDELKARNLKPTKENMSYLGDEMRKKSGQDALAQKLIEKIKESGAKSVVVSGVRSPEEANYLKNHSKRFVLIKLTADTNKRVKRSDNADIKSRDENDIKNKGLSKVLDMASIAIENNGTIDELFVNLDEVIACQELL